MSSDRSWVHSLFWPKRIGAGDYRFCKVCYPQEEEQPSVDEVKYLIDNQFLPSHAFKGCVQYVSSPSGLANHIRSKHPAQVPDHIQLQRSAGTLGNKNAKLDLELLTLWAQHIVIGSLREVDLIDDPRVRAVLAPRLPGLAHEDRLQKEVDSCIERIRLEVRTIVQKAKAEGAKFCVSADSWKRLTKGNVQILGSRPHETVVENLQFCLWGTSRHSKQSEMRRKKRVLAAPAY